jgi:hypothetical protein
MGVDRVREMRLMSLLMRPDRRAVNDRRALAKTRNRRRGGRFPQRAHRRAAPTRGARADETPPRIRARADFFLTLSMPSPRSGRRRAARSSVAAARLARRSAPPPRVTMSLVAQSRRHLARWATRAAVRPMAIIPESHQVKEKKDAQRVDFFGDQQAIDSRCVRTTTRFLSRSNRKRRFFPRGMCALRTSSGTGGANRPEPPGAVPQSRQKDAKSNPRTTTNPKKKSVS